MGEFFLGEYFGDFAGGVFRGLKQAGFVEGFELVDDREVGFVG